MKKPKLNKYVEEDKQYVVYLGNGTSRSFSSKAAAKQYLAQTNDFLYDQVYQINSLLIDIYTIYRQLWGYFENDKNTDQGNLFRADEYCKGEIVKIEKALDLCMRRSGKANGNYFAFVHLTNCITAERTIIRELYDLIHKKSIPDREIQLSQFYLRSQIIENALTNYGHSPDVRLFHFPLHSLEALDTEFIPNKLDYKPVFKLA